MSQNNQNSSQDQEDLSQLHMCELKAKGLMEEIDRRSTDPTVVCGKCLAKANRPEDLHNPRPLKKKAIDSLWG
ncbi:MAG TPA: hypothetical protein VJ974_06335 [Geopsychrobacteraceae bacterium]|nr:hypothetical protein [Geopsychrobacteraceae bacterium]